MQPSNSSCSNAPLEGTVCNRGHFRMVTVPAHRFSGKATKFGHSLMVRRATVRPLGKLIRVESRSNFKLLVRKPSAAVPERIAFRAASSEVKPLGNDRQVTTAHSGRFSGFRPLVTLALQDLQKSSTILVHHGKIPLWIIFALSPDAVVSGSEFDGLVFLMRHPCWRTKDT